MTSNARCSDWTALPRAKQTSTILSGRRFTTTMSRPRRFALAFAIALVAGLVPVSRASAAGWAYGTYLYRYLFWGIRTQISRSDQYKMSPYRTIDTAPPAFHFTPGEPGSVPTTVEYKDGDAAKR